MGTAKVKLDKELVEKIKKVASLSGYATPEEFIAHCLEKELAALAESDSEEEIKKKLKGLGYIS